MTKTVLPLRARTALQLVADGRTPTEASGLMGISRQGVSSALATARTKLLAQTTGEAIARGIRRGLID